MRRSNLIRFFSLAILFHALLTPIGCRPAPNPTNADQTDVDRLLHLTEQRLLLMDDVALWKWNSGLPISDPKRESEVLDKVVERGQAKGLDSNLVRRFFTAQMEGARAVQQLDFDRFDHLSVNKSKPSPDAQNMTVLRQRIDALNDELIDALAALAPRLTSPPVQLTLKQRADNISISAIRAPVLQIVLAPLLR